ncbi:hypothetical protein K491DRAFT_722809 [Lophiostoma macrostomum CBS 122681]|uniref:Alcohol acetyltransferase n=1 Tax=Lophiostoma macrostomum CBS 122681 TaxID=1314788 RepID=A0A6A6SJU7_9PLEO|nr:hypothetical protein K491DRAFT_722809 [Lophiostoma macrostomum CBS 122681]
MADFQTPSEKLRFCGKLEQFSTARHHLGFYTNVQLSATYSHPTSIVSLEPLIFAALRKIISQHSILSAIPLDEHTDSPYFARLPSIDLRTCVEFLTRKSPIPRDGQPDEELETIIAIHHNKNFKDGRGTKPFWRLIVLHAPSAATTEFTASWVYHHALADGASGLVFQHHFLAALQSLSRSDLLKINSEPIVKSSTSPLLPSLESLHPLPISIWFLLKTLWRQWFPASRVGLWTGNCITPPSADSTPTTTRTKTLVLDKVTTKRLVQLSRREGTTLTGTLQSIIAASIFINLRDSGKDHQHTRLHSSGAISLRRFLTLPSHDSDGNSLAELDINEQIGTWAGPYDFDHYLASSKNRGLSKATRVADLFSWTEARAIKAAISTEVSKNLSNNPIGLMRYISSIPTFFTSQIGKERSDSFELSNVGVSKGLPPDPVFVSGKEVERDRSESEEGGKWQVGRCVFSQCASVAGAAVQVSAVTGGDGNAVLVFSWSEDVVDGKLVEGVVRDVEEGVRSILSDGKGDEDAVKVD